MTTRLGNAADFQAVLPMMRQRRLRRQQADPGLYALHPDAEQRFRRWIGDMARDPRSTMLVAEEEGQVIGFLYATVEKDPPIFLHEEFALVREWWVDAPSRRHGAGKALIDAAAAELGATGVRQMRVRTAASDQDVRELLARCGFRPGVCEIVKELQGRDVSEQLSKHRSYRKQKEKVP
jgi:L-amino acid N-acyltransferase YncA